MLCENCGKRPATIRIVQMMGSEKEEHHFCEVCAQGQSALSVLALNDPAGAEDFLKLLLAASQPEEVQEETVRCLECGLTYEEFSHKGTFGCSGCFDAFEEKIGPMVRRIHGSAQHNGKVPRHSGAALQMRRHIQGLRQQLEQHVRQEEYEEAARLRDEIRSLEMQSQRG